MVKMISSISISFNNRFSCDVVKRWATNYVVDHISNQWNSHLFWDYLEVLLITRELLVCVCVCVFVFVCVLSSKNTY